eukprot:PhF_6_TR11197/c0_g1_i1/m.18053
MSKFFAVLFVAVLVLSQGQVFAVAPDTPAPTTVGTTQPPQTTTTPTTTVPPTTTEAPPTTTTSAPNITSTPTATPTKTPTPSSGNHTNSPPLPPDDSDLSHANSVAGAVIGGNVCILLMLYLATKKFLSSPPIEYEALHNYGN